MNITQIMYNAYVDELEKIGGVDPLMMKLATHPDSFNVALDLFEKDAKLRLLGALGRKKGLGHWAKMERGALPASVNQPAVGKTLEQGAQFGQRTVKGGGLSQRVPTGKAVGAIR
jgi:hypothetical protein